MKFRPAFLSVLLAGTLSGACAPPAEEGFCSVADDIVAGSAHARVGAGLYETATNVTWEDLGGPGVFINFPTAGNVMMTISIQTTLAGTAISEALATAGDEENSAFPIEAAIGNRATDGADLTVTQDNSSTSSANGEGGRLLLTELVNDELWGCFYGSTDEVEVTRGSFAAVPQ